MNGREEDFLPSLEKSVTLLAVSSLPADRDRLRQLLSHGNSELHEASDCRQGRDYADGNWEDLLKATARYSPHRTPCVFSRLAEESLWKVLNLGGFDLLITPFEPEEVWRITLAAWSRKGM